MKVLNGGKAGEGDTRKIDLDALILQLNGRPFGDPEKIDKVKGAAPLTLRAVCIAALTAPDKAEPVDLIRRAKLAKEIHSKKANEIELSDFNIELMKVLIGKTITLPLVLEQTWELLSQEA